MDSGRQLRQLRATMQSWFNEFGEPGTRGSRSPSEVRAVVIVKIHCLSAPVLTSCGGAQVSRELKELKQRVSQLKRAAAENDAAHGASPHRRLREATSF